MAAAAAAAASLSRKIPGNLHYREPTRSQGSKPGVAMENKQANRLSTAESMGRVEKLVAGQIPSAAAASTLSTWMMAAVAAVGAAAGAAAAAAAAEDFE